MRFGFSLALAASASAADLRAVVSDVEASGFNTLWVSDHVLTPRAWRFVSTESGAAPGGFAERYRLEALTVLAHLAAATSVLRLGTSVVVGAQREPYLFAKQVATTDLLSGGRLRMGVGVGWCADEFARLGASFDDRGRRTDELILRCRRLWAGGDDDPDVEFAPVVERAGGIPILVGGSSDHAIRRAVRLGDGWMPASAFATASVEAFAELDGRFRTALAASGRARVDVPVALKVHLDLDGDDPAAVLRGAPAAIAETIGRYGELGVDELIVDLKVPPSAEGARRTIGHFAERVVPLL